MARKSKKKLVVSIYYRKDGKKTENSQLLTEKGYKEWLKYPYGWHLDAENEDFCRKLGLECVEFNDFSQKEPKIIRKYY